MSKHTCSIFAVLTLNAIVGSISSVALAQSVPEPTVSRTPSVTVVRPVQRKGMSPIVTGGTPRRAAVTTGDPAVPGGRGGREVATEGGMAPSTGAPETQRTISHLRAALNYLADADQAMQNGEASESPMGYLRQAYAELTAAAGNPAYRGKRGEAMTLASKAYDALESNQRYAAPDYATRQAAVDVRFCISTGK